MKRRLRPLLLLTAILGAFAARAITLDLNQAMGAIKDSKTAPPDADEAQERALGRVAAGCLLGVAKPLPDRELQTYVGRVGLWIALQSERAELSWRFVVLDTADIDSFAAPGGYVFVTRGLLGRLHSEAELAGVLGHEIAHVVLRHQFKALERSTDAQVLRTFAADTAAQQAGHGSLAAPELQALAVQAGTLYAHGLEASDEFAADRLGVMLAARAGYDPYGLAAALQTLDAMDAGDPALALWRQTLPPAPQRLAQLELMREQLDGFGEQPVLDYRYARSVARLAAPK